MFRDICGVPARPFYPYVKDPLSISLIKQNKVLEVGSCWNGVVAFRAALIVWRGDGATMTSSPAENAKQALVGQGTSLRKRGWQMVDNGTFVTCREENVMYADNFTPRPYWLAVSFV